VEGTYEHCNEPPGSIKFCETLEQLTAFQEGHGVSKKGKALPVRGHGGP
jgi:hypothetical protein